MRVYSARGDANCHAIRCIGDHDARCRNLEDDRSQRFCFIDDERDLLAAFGAREFSRAVISDANEFENLTQRRCLGVGDEKFAQLRFQFALLLLELVEFG